MNQKISPPIAAGADELAAITRINRRVLISTIVFSCMVNILMLTGPLFMLQIYDRVLTAGSVPTLVALMVVTLILYAYYGLLDFIRARLMVRIGRKVEEGLRSRVYDAIVVHALRRSQGVGSQPLNDLATVRQYLSGQGPFAFFDMPWVVVYLGVIAAAHWMLGLAGLVSAILIFAMAILSERRTRAPLQDATKAAVKAMLMTEEARRNTEALHALGMVGTMRDRWADVQQSALDYQTRANDAGGGLAAISRVLRLIVQSGILGLGAYLAINHEMSAGSMIACTIILSRALAPVETAIANWQQFLAYRKARERLAQVLKVVPMRPVRMKLPAPAGRLDVESLMVSVQGQEKPLLQGISFGVGPGEGIGVIGPTGAGKSTLARALVGIAPNMRGAIRVDGATLDQRDPDELGQMIGYLPQDVQLFDGTVQQNISRFDPNVTPEKVIEAAKLANVHDLIMRLPDGYNTPLGENGSRLSAGQRQRMALARALYNDPVLLVLDEPNSNLDAEGEAALDHGIRRSLARGAAVVVIAHRPSALAAISKMLVLSDGKMAAFGPRDDVLRKVVMRPGANPNQPAPANVGPQPTLQIAGGTDLS